MKTACSIFLMLLFFPAFLNAQVKISGTITDTKGNPLPGANIFLKDTYDGATSGMEGEFSFETEEQGKQILVVRFISFKPEEREVQLGSEEVKLQISLKEEINKLDGVTITAGSFGASDSKKAVGLSPLEIVTTASAMGDIAKAMQTMPGAQMVAEDGRLFVRGGTGEETQVFIDGLYVQNPYQASLQEVPTRGRFSPFLFKGTLFSTGGYSAEFGQAMSSVLSLQTKDLATESQTDISLMSVGADVEHTQAMENQSLAGKVSYVNLAPYMGLVKQNIDWHQAPESGEASLAYRRKDSHSGLLKVYGNHQFQNLSMSQPDLFREGKQERISLNSRNSFFQSHYRRPAGKKSVAEAGLSYTNDFRQMERNDQGVDTEQNSLHLKTKLVTDVSDRISLNSGVEVLRQAYGSTLYDENQADYKREFTDYLGAAYAEGDVYLSNRLVARLGGRFDYSTTLEKGAVSPRLSLAYETGEASQISFAYGKFYQKPQNNYLEVNSALDFEHSTHYILNYQYEKKGNYLRLEGFHKEYDNLIRYEQQGLQDFSFRNLNNGGHGFARGLELFFRSKSAIKDADFWVSYSLLDTRRLFRNYTEESVPSFASTHNASFIYKHFVSSLRSQVGASFSVASGRPYHNPNKDGFNQERTDAYQNLSLNWAFLYRPNIIFYSAVSNVFGADNIGGYQYAAAPDEAGIYQSRPITLPARRFFFLGVFITLTKNKQENQLDRL